MYKDNSTETVMLSLIKREAEPSISIYYTCTPCACIRASPETFFLPKLLLYRPTLWAQISFIWNSLKIPMIYILTLLLALSVPIYTC